MVSTPQDFPDFTRGVLLLGVDGDGNQVGVLLDTDGNLNCILKGQGATGLETISVDENGRIQAFVLDDESQWGDVIKVGNADLAARLGSLQNWDWRGSVLFDTDFSTGSGFLLKYPSGAGSAITLDPTYWLHGGYSLKIVGGSDGTRTSYITGEIGHPPSARIGFQVAYSLIGNPETVTLELRRWIGGKTYYARQRHNRDDYDLEYQNAAGAYVKLRDCFPPGEDEAFSYYKVVCDISTLKYTRSLYSGYEDDLTAQLMLQSGTGFLDALYYTLTVVSRSGQNDGIYLDHILLTDNEPE